METIYILKLIVYILLIIWLFTYLVKWFKFNKAYYKLLDYVDNCIDKNIDYIADYSINGGKSLNVLLTPNNKSSGKLRLQYNKKYDTVIINNNGNSVHIRMFSYNKKSSNKVLNELLNTVEQLTSN